MILDRIVTGGVLGRRMGLAVVAVLAAMVLAPSSARADVRVRNYDVLVNAERAESGGELGPIAIAGTRNGTFSGAVAVESAAAVKGLKATMGPLAGPGGARIPAENVRVRYAVAWDGSFRQYRPSGLDILLESPPAEVKPGDRGRAALVGVWVTVTVPAAAAPGTYAGQLVVEAEGLPARNVPVHLTVAEWVIPDAQQWRTWVEMIQSPDTLALEYDVPLWSERHWAMIARSMDLIGQTGSRVVYIPLISRTNQGNEQSMVRWIRQADGSWKHDFSVMEKYLDTAVKHMGKPKMVVLYAWDIYLATKDERPTVDPKAHSYAQEQQRLAQKRWDLQTKGMAVSMLDEKTGEVTTDYLPHYRAEESREPWQRVFQGLRERLKARGLEEAMVLGMVNDSVPPKEDVAFLNDISGGLPWIAHLHPPRTRGRKPVGNKLLHGIADVCYEAHVYSIRYEATPGKNRVYGWQLPEHRAFFGRHGIPNGAALRVRLLPEVNITGGQRGVGRIGADYWYVIKNSRGERVGASYARYPENMWRNLNIDSWLLAPGPDGPVATARYENLREGVQECEARIALEMVLTNPEAVKQVGDDLAARAQALLDDRQRSIWRSVWTNEEQLKLLDTLGMDGNARNEHEAIWQTLTKKGVKLPDFWDGEARRMRDEEYRKGEQWFAASGWQKRNADLFRLAAEVQGRLKK